MKPVWWVLANSLCNTPITVMRKTYSLSASIVSYCQQEHCNTQGIPITQHLHNVINLLT